MFWRNVGLQMFPNSAKKQTTIKLYKQGDEFGMPGIVWRNQEPSKYPSLKTTPINIISAWFSFALPSTRVLASVNLACSQFFPAVNVINLKFGNLSRAWPGEQTWNMTINFLRLGTFEIFKAFFFFIVLTANKVAVSLGTAFRHDTHTLHMLPEMYV